MIKQSLRAPGELPGISQVPLGIPGGSPGDRGVPHGSPGRSQLSPLGSQRISGDPQAREVTGPLGIPKGGLFENVGIFSSLKMVNTKVFANIIIIQTHFKTIMLGSRTMLIRPPPLDPRGIPRGVPRDPVEKKRSR